jgi:hypothetical protein
MGKLPAHPMVGQAIRFAQKSLLAVLFGEAWSSEGLRAITVSRPECHKGWSTAPLRQDSENTLWSGSSIHLQRCLPHRRYQKTSPLGGNAILLFVKTSPPEGTGAWHVPASRYTPAQFSASRPLPSEEGLEKVVRMARVFSSHRAIGHSKWIIRDDTPLS